MSIESPQGEPSLNLEPDNPEIPDVPEFSIGVKKPPPLYPNHKDNPDTSLLDHCFKRDVVWSMLDALPDLPDSSVPVGSWKAFNKQVTDKEVCKSLLEYLPVIPQPPEYPVCKKFLDQLLDLMNDLEIDHIYAHADEQVYAKLAHILWKFPDTYKNVTILMGGFHQLRVRQRMLHKRHGCRGFKSWWIDAGIIASGSAEKAAEGNHYYRSMRLHKECFNALIQFRVE